MSMSISVRTKLARWLLSCIEAEWKAEMKAQIDSHFTEYPEVLRHKIPHREPKEFTMENRQ